MTIKNNKSLGQHWLKDRAILDEIASEAMLTFDDPGAEQPMCVEIGPGLGTLTSALLRVFPKVLAIEFDARLAKNLPASFPGKNLEVVNQDILSFDFSQIPEPYVVAGNIPYYITSPIISKLLMAEPRPERIVLLIQKEVAERILATAGEHTYLSLSVQNRAKVTAGVSVPREFFTPPPKVDSATIILEPLEAPLVSDGVMDFVKRGFSNPRKKLLKNLGVEREKALTVFSEVGVSENARPADLTLEQWEALYNLFH